MDNALVSVAPGRPLREGIERILQANMGALIVVGDDDSVLNICSGGFLFDAEFTPQRLSELAKMDGAIILAPDASRIARANVHLVPDPNVETTETGTRHRTAERVARSIDVPVISVSEDLSIITVYRNDLKHLVEPIPRLLNRANQALQTLERYRNRLDSVTATLSALEVEDLVTLRDVVTVIQRAEMVRRIAEEINSYVLQLGEDGRLVTLQLDELMMGVGDSRRLVVRDYMKTPSKLDRCLNIISSFSPKDLSDPEAVGKVLGLSPEMKLESSGLEPRGYRLLIQIPRLSMNVVNSLVEHFKNLRNIMQASIEELDAVEGIGEARAKAIKEGLARVAESSILER